MKRLLSVLLAAAFLCGTCIFAAAADTVPEGWTGIYTPAQLDAVRENLSAKYILMNDIDLSGWSNWVPIGYQSDFAGQDFTGVFNGNGRSIRGLRIQKGYGSNNSYPSHGLFWALNGALVENLSLENAYVEASSGRLGILAGSATGGTLRNCKAAGKIRAEGSGISYVGGLIAAASKTVMEDLRFDGEIYAKDTSRDTGVFYVGGLAGAGDKFTRCESSGTLTTDSAVIAGGIAGALNGAAECVNKMNIEVGFGPISYVGGDAGGIAGLHHDIGDGTIVRCKNVGSIIGSETAGGIAGIANSPIISCENSGNISAYPGQAASIGGIAGHTDETLLRDCVNTGQVGMNTTARNAGGVAGYMEETQMLYCRNYGKVSAVHGGWSTSSVNCGGLAGSVAGSTSVGNISSSHIYASFNMGDVFARAGAREGSVIKSAVAGGLAGKLAGLQSSMVNCYNRGNLEAVSESYAAVGGLAADVGSNNTHIYIGSCYSSGAIKLTAPEGKHAGGLAGQATGVNIQNSYYAWEYPYDCMIGYRLSGARTYSASRLAAAQMKQSASFAGFDFNTIWTIGAGQNDGLPRLRALDLPDGQRSAMPGDYGVRPITEEEQPPDPLRLISDSAAFTVDYLGTLHLNAVGGSGSYRWRISEAKATRVTWTHSGTGFFKLTSLKSFTKSFKVTITVFDEQNRETSCEVKIRPTFLQWLQVIFLFGWIWL